MASTPPALRSDGPGPAALAILGPGVGLHRVLEPVLCHDLRGRVVELRVGPEVRCVERGLKIPVVSLRFYNNQDFLINAKRNRRRLQGTAIG